MNKNLIHQITPDHLAVLFHGDLVDLQNKRLNIFRKMATMLITAVVISIALIHRNLILQACLASNIALTIHALVALLDNIRLDGY